VQSLWQLYVTFGFMVGFAVGAFYAPLTSTATSGSPPAAGSAVALVSAGIGIGILVIAPLARALTSWADWRMALLVLGDIAWLVSSRWPLIREQPGTSGARAMGGAAAGGREYSHRRGLATPQFWASRSPTSRAARRTRARSSTWSRTPPIRASAPMAAATALGVSGFSSIVGRSAAGCWPIASAPSRPCWPAWRCRPR
jgi:hypothetical protein